MAFNERNPHPTQQQTMFFFSILLLLLYFVNGITLQVIACNNEENVSVISAEVKLNSFLLYQ
jgi:hypothetical protein